MLSFRNKNVLIQSYYCLEALGVHVNKSELSDQLLTHPDYPSLLALSDTLTSINVENHALKISNDDLFKLTTPFLAYINEDDSNILCVKEVTPDLVIVGKENGRDDKIKLEEFKKMWNGVVLIAEESSPNQRNTKSKHRNETDTRNIIVVSFSVTIIILFGAVFDIGHALLGLVLTGGVLVSIFLQLKESEVYNSFSERICRTNKRCDAVLKSEGAYIIGKYKMSDLVFIYFSSSLLCWWFNSIFTNSSFIWTALLQANLVAIAFTAYSIYYQARVVKAWCLFCSLVIGIVWLELLVLTVTGTQLFNPKLHLQDIILLLTCLMVSFVSIRLYKSMINIRRQLEIIKIEHKRIKRDPIVFSNLGAQAKMVTQERIFNDIIIGNPEGLTQLIIACNPHCVPCAKAHEIIDLILDKYQKEIGVTLRFLVDSDNPNNANSITFSHIQNLLLNGNNLKPVLRDWFRSMDFKQFAAANKVAKQYDTSDYLKFHQSWFEKNGITQTPSIFINGFGLPRHFKINDLVYSMGDIIQYNKLRNEVV